MHPPISRCFTSLPRKHKPHLEIDKTLKSLCFSGRLSEAVDLLCSNGSSPVRPQTYSYLLQECVNRKQLFLGQRIHGRMVTVGFPADDYLTTKLLILYSKNDDMDTARKLFDRVPKRDRVPWNTMIRDSCERDSTGALSSSIMRCD
ncbi:Pentatricopeptide repeat-containing protein [Acorus calamus]|uniref:Pentatricopeptide repeat-containing protein n=1 Tax=Acorus calamus TaxID=4465 RepID=A0AAV9CTP8_ACOCL|nr:Pentatricopeptide repeat-containing protein [Acorus calamus]